MAKIKAFTANVHSGTAGFLIRVEGEVNCGLLDVEPTIIENESPGHNPTILLLKVSPASDQTPEAFRKGSFSKNLQSKDQYKQVELLDPNGKSIGTIPVEIDH